MYWYTSSSEHPTFANAITEATDDLATAFGRMRPDVVFAFVSIHHHAHFGSLATAIRRQLGKGVRIAGCSGASVIANAREFEKRPALSLTAAVLPDVVLAPFRVTEPELASLYADDSGWETRVGIPAAHDPSFILLPEPFTCDMGMMLRGLDSAYPSGVKVGGLASGGDQPGVNALFLDDEVYEHGAVGLAMAGNVQVDAIVAQGCRPIGPPAFVTQSHANLILELDGRSPLEVLQETYEQLDAPGKELFSRALHIGVATDHHGQTHAPGDYLVRNIVGIDAATGALAVAARIAPHTVVQLHVRDARASEDDLKAVLGHHVELHGRIPPAGALLFSCLGRGQGLYGRLNHDSEAFQLHLGPAPLGGFFGHGEVGPVQDRTHVHGYTSAFALFRPRLVH